MVSQTNEQAFGISKDFLGLLLCFRLNIQYHNRKNLLFCGAQHKNMVYMYYQNILA